MMYNMIELFFNQSTNKRSRAMAARNELYRKTMNLLENELDGNEDPNLEDIVQRYFQKRNSGVSKNYINSQKVCPRDVNRGNFSKRSQNFI